MINIQIHSKKYGNKLVLNSINLNFEKGKVYGIVGDNGAGKTTFFNCFCGLEEFEGTIKSTALSLKNKIGYLPTEPYFFDKMTGKEYLQFFCNARRLYGVPIQKRNVFELPLDQYTLNYSTGMKKN
ncbi:ATP-binding cassette domain-containing protein [Flavobacterium davisii]|uniref:ATP-binding cassette domain-containing protein n=1 Tax=Flavobacterium davisii TaxID=2906077 RepID=UPI002164D090|nr:ATP-binding cassette domain-containing protein [Flavobacterium davisii]